MRTLRRLSKDGLTSGRMNWCRKRSSPRQPTTRSRIRLWRNRNKPDQQAEEPARVTHDLSRLRLLCLRPGAYLSAVWADTRHLAVSVYPARVCRPDQFPAVSRRDAQVRCALDLQFDHLQLLLVLSELEAPQ